MAAAASAYLLTVSGQPHFDNRELGSGLEAAASAYLPALGGWSPAR